MAAKKIHKFMCFVIVILCFVLSFIFGKNIPFEIQKLLANSIISVSSIIFGVLGIWIGLIAPDTIKAIYSSDKNNIQDKHKKWKELESLYKPVFISLILFIIMTCFSFLGEILKTITKLLKHREIFRIIGFFVLSNSFFITIYLIFISIKPGIEMLAISFSFIRRNKNMDNMYPDK